MGIQFSFNPELVGTLVGIKRKVLAFGIPTLCNNCKGSATRQQAAA